MTLSFICRLLAGCLGKKPKKCSEQAIPNGPLQRRCK